MLQKTKMIMKEIFYDKEQLDRIEKKDKLNKKLDTHIREICLYMNQ